MTDPVNEVQIELPIDDPREESKDTEKKPDTFAGLKKGFLSGGNKKKARKQKQGKTLEPVVVKRAEETKCAKLPDPLPAEEFQITPFDAPAEFKLLSRPQQMELLYKLKNFKAQN